MDEENKKTDDVVIEQDEFLDDSVVSEENAFDIIKKLRAKIKELEKEKAEYLGGWQRTKADYANLVREEDKKRIETIKYANADLIEGIIPALDSFDMAMGNKEVWEKVDKNWRVGIEYIYSQILSSLEKFGLTQDNPLGQKFDLFVHHSIGTVKTDDPAKEGVISEVAQRGYTLNGKAIKPANVKVFELEKKNS